MGKNRGVDHGLGGRDNEKSRARRAKKASVTKKIAMAALRSGPKKGEVTFNEAARVEYLTGFHKRKQERRKYGLTKQIEKEKKKHKDEVKSHRDAVRSVRVEDNQKLDEIAEDLRQGERVRTKEISKQMVFQDDQTKAMFGDVVTVVVDTAGLAERLEQRTASTFQPQQGTKKLAPPKGGNSSRSGSGGRGRGQGRGGGGGRR
jgi:ribosomal RNA-processing protein 17